MSHRPKAICLLSGGLDSSTCLAMAIRDGFDCYCLSFDYGQRHRIELTAAAGVARNLKAKDHRVAVIDLRIFGYSALTDAIEVPKGRNLEQMGGGIPVTYVAGPQHDFPVFCACIRRSSRSLGHFIGVNAIDYSGYPDCRPDSSKPSRNWPTWLRSQALRDGRGCRFTSPLTRCQNARHHVGSGGLEVDFGLTHSCYDPDARGISCGDVILAVCAQRFAEAGFHDPIATPSKWLRRWM